MIIDSGRISISGDNFLSDELFGGNILSSQGHLLGDGSYEDAINSLGVTGIRFPGGSLTEFLFDINDPNARMAIDERDGTTKSLISLTDFMTYANQSEQPVTIVVPTRTLLSEETDENGNRLPLIDEDSLRHFISDVVNGEYGSAEIRAFEVGNEYWGAGQMNAVEYGRLAAEMTAIIDSELNIADKSEINIIVQGGNNFGYSRISEDYEGISAAESIEDLNFSYNLQLGSEALFSSGEVNWGYVNNRLVMNGFEQADELSSVDGVVTHIYTRGDIATSTRYFNLDQINNTWIDENPDLEIYVTEWNLKSTAGLDRDEDYGLFQASEMLEIVEEFARAGVDKAQVWPLTGTTRNSLSDRFDFEEPSAAGEMFSLMSETLPGKVLIDLNPDSRDTEVDSGSISVHMFAGENELALYVVNGSSEDGVSTEIDLSNFFVGYESSDIVVLGVADGEAPGSNRSDAIVEDLDSSILQNGVLNASLEPGEIMQVVLAGVVPTEEFASVWEDANSIDLFYVSEPEDDDGWSEDPAIPTLPVNELEDVVDDTPESDDDDSGSFGVEWIIGLLALAAGFGGVGVG